MDSIDVISFFTKALYLTVLLSLPSIVVASVVGVVMALLQALTQIQDQTLPFAVKLIAVGVALVLTGRWVGGELYNYTLQTFDIIPAFAAHAS